MNLGLVYIDLAQYSQAIEFFSRAEPILCEIHDEYRSAMLYNNIGYVHSILKAWETAEQAYLVSIERWRALGDPHSLADTLDGLGVVYLEQGRNEKAVYMFHDALQVLSQADLSSDQGFLQQTIHQHLQEVQHQDT